MVTLNLTENEANVLKSHLEGIAPNTNSFHKDHEEVTSIINKLP